MEKSRVASSRRVQRLLRSVKRRERKRDWRWKLADFYARAQQAVLDQLPRADVVLKAVEAAEEQLQLARRRLVELE